MYSTYSSLHQLLLSNVKKSKLFEEKLVDPNAKDIQEQSRKPGRYPTADICYRIRQPVKFLVRKLFNQQFYSGQNEKNRNGKYQWVYVQDVFVYLYSNLIT
jgi:hypothetical protein